VEAVENVPETVDLYLDLESEVALEPLGSAAVAVKDPEMTARLLRHLGICPKSFSLERSWSLALGRSDWTLSSESVAGVTWGCEIVDGGDRIDRHPVMVVSRDSESQHI